jgi:hypothetical protein
MLLLEDEVKTYHRERRDRTQSAQRRRKRVVAVPAEELLKKI